MQSTSRVVPSLVKWTGSKRSQASQIAEHIPPHNRYLEPFLGGGAVLYLVGRPGSLASDIYKPLINLWRQVQSNPFEFVDNYTHQWITLQSRGPDYFYEVRARFNQYEDPFDLNFLLRTCVNGIVRFNQNGDFNNSFHLSRSGMRPEQFARVVKSWHQAIHGVHFACSDYREPLSRAQASDFVYLDPPYANTRMRYTYGIDVNTLFHELEALNTRRVLWALSFDGTRGTSDLSQAVPSDLYRRRLLLPSGHSPVGKVLNSRVERVHESLYLNF